MKKIPEKLREGRENKKKNQIKGLLLLTICLCLQKYTAVVPEFIYLGTCVYYMNYSKQQQSGPMSTISCVWMEA